MQVAPVVHFGGRTAICKASIRTQPVFKHFEILRLETSIRQGKNLAFSSFLDSIGDNYIDASVDLGRLNHTQSVQELIDFVFPPTIVADASICITRAILSPFDAFVDEFNSIILRSVPGQTHCYVSSDSMEGSGDASTETVFADPEFLNALQEIDVELLDTASHSPPQLSFSTSRFRVHSPPKTNTTSIVLRNDLQWLPRSNCTKIGP